jgi:hypothetical protein
MPGSNRSTTSTSTARDRSTSNAWVASPTVVTIAPVGSSCFDKMYPVASSSSTTSTLTAWRDGKAASGTGETVAKLAPALKGADEHGSDHAQVRTLRLSVPARAATMRTGDGPGSLLPRVPGSTRAAPRGLAGVTPVVRHLRAALVARARQGGRRSKSLSGSVLVPLKLPRREAPNVDMEHVEAGVVAVASELNLGNCTC